MNETPKPKSRWRIPRRILIVLAVLATLIALLYTEEDWRGKHDWNSYKSEWEAKGEKFDWQAFVPQSVPDDQNFFTAPVFTNMLANRIKMSVLSVYRDDGSFPKLRSSYWAAATMTDLQGWQTYYRGPHNVKVPNEFPIAPQPQTPAADVLLALSKYDSTIEQLRQAAQRPYANIPMNYEDGFSSASTLLPYLAKLKQCAQMLELRAVAELANGQSDKAMDDVMLLFRLNDTIRTQPFLITHLVHIAILSITLQPIWEGLVRHAWTDGQLSQINTELGKLDFLADYEFAMRGERAFAIQTFENERITRESTTVITESGTNEVVTIHYRLTPASFFYQNQLAFARMSQQYVLPLMDTNAYLVSPSKVEHTEETVKGLAKHPSVYNILALFSISEVSASARRFAYAQAGVDLARVACALERYRLAHGAYPETLDALASQYLPDIPHDIINGQPLHYRPTSDGNFLLYSVGWNETDDGGQIVFTKNGNVDRDKGDWVWPATAK